jgi:uncharacterized protein
MTLELGHIEALFRYPIKSMRGEALDAASLTWHGLAGDRRLALRRIDERGEFPWLSASRLPDLIHFTPVPRDDGNRAAPPTHVRTPEGDVLPVFGEELAADLSRRYGAAVVMMQLKHGIFDEASLSIITAETIGEICRLAGRPADVRRFRPNILVRTTRPVPFEEDPWVGGVLSFGDAADAPTVSVTMRDQRCAMVNLDPQGGPSTPEMMKAVVRANQLHAGVYGAVTRIGRLAVGQAVVLHR